MSTPSLILWGPPACTFTGMLTLEDNSGASQSLLPYTRFLFERLSHELPDEAHPSNATAARHKACN